MGTGGKATSLKSSALSTVDKGMFIDLIKEQVEVIKDKTKTFYATNKKAMAWLEILNKFNDMTGHGKIQRYDRPWQDSQAD